VNRFTFEQDRDTVIDRIHPLAVIGHQCFDQGLVYPHALVRGDLAGTDGPVDPLQLVFFENRQALMGYRAAQNGKQTFVHTAYCSASAALQHIRELDISMALGMRNPGIIANAALDIARKFSVFYNECPVLSAPDEETRETRIKICIATRQVLENLLGLLGIELPERM